jgi:DNA-binding transcriptional ArsR family regulator
MSEASGRALSPGDLDSARLAEVMKALSSPVRIDLLKSLRYARTLGEIRLKANRRDRSGSEGRIMSRVTVRQHLDRLLELGVVRCVRRVRDGRALDHYIVNHTQLFALLVDLRSLVHLRPEEEALEGTMPGAAPPPLAAPGAKLALLDGDGRVFPLDGPVEAWRIGRRGGVAVCLDYDPYLSLENTEVVRRGAGFAAVDLGSRNGTMLNGGRLEPGRAAPLEHGDVLGVGRSILLFRDH